jgi:hypothetical protein
MDMTWIVRFFGMRGEEVEVKARNDLEAGTKALRQMARQNNPKLYEEIQSITKKSEPRSNDYQI